jgi:uncharacterized protein (DUF1330 family)
VSAYMIADITVRDAELYVQYIAAAQPIVAAFGGRYLARGGPVITVAGDWTPERVVVIEFPNIDKLRECFASPEYRRVALLRERSTTGRAIAVEGC